MKMWLLIFAGVFLAGAPTAAQNWAAGADSDGRAAAQTNAEGLALIESWHFPGGLRFMLQDTLGAPIEDIHLDYQIDPDSVIAARFTDPQGRWGPRTIWGKNAQRKIAIPLRLPPDRVGPGVGEMSVLLDVEHPLRLVDTGISKAFTLAQLVDFIRHSSTTGQERWLLALDYYGTFILLDFGLYAALG